MLRCFKDMKKKQCWNFNTLYFCFSLGSSTWLFGEIFPLGFPLLGNIIHSVDITTTAFLTASSHPVLVSVSESIQWSWPFSRIAQWKSVHFQKCVFAGSITFKNRPQLGKDLRLWAKLYKKCIHLSSLFALEPYFHNNHYLSLIRNCHYLARDNIHWFQTYKSQRAILINFPVLG